MRRVEMDHKAKIAWVKNGDIPLASFAFEEWGGANKAQMAAETYLTERQEDPWELHAKIEALEARVAAADKLAEAVDDFGNLKPSDSSGNWGLRLSRCLSELAAYQATKEGKGYE